MKNKPRSNSWEMKRIKREQSRYVAAQNKKNEMMADTLLEIQRSHNKMQEVMLAALKESDKHITEQLTLENVKMREVISLLHEDLNQTQELVKILVANQLIDQI